MVQCHYRLNSVCPEGLKPNSLVSKDDHAETPCTLCTSHALKFVWLLHIEVDCCCASVKITVHGHTTALCFELRFATLLYLLGMWQDLSGENSSGRVHNSNEALFNAWMSQLMKSDISVL